MKRLGRGILAIGLVALAVLVGVHPGSNRALQPGGVNPMAKAPAGQPTLAPPRMAPAPTQPPQYPANGGINVLCVTVEAETGFAEPARP